MKKILAVFLLTCMVTTAWAAQGGFVNKIKLTEIPVEIKANGLPLADLLSVLSEQSGVNIIAVPEVAELQVDLRVEAHETLEKFLVSLARNYQLAYRMNEKRNAVIIFPAPRYAEYGLPLSLGAMHKSGWPEQSRLSAYVAPSPLDGYLPSVAFNTEEYRRIYDNSYHEALSSPLSTFSIDVDTASYSNVRRFINSGQLPPPDAVRTEEMINYFTYDYPEPLDGHPIAVTAEVGACPWQPAHKLVMIGLKGKSLPKEELPPGNLVFLIDVSGSMAEPSKLPLLKTAFKLLVKELRNEDRVSIVVYAGRAGVVLDSTPGSDKDTIVRAIDSLAAGGSTAGGEGIELAYRIAKKNFCRAGNNRVILATDGDFNVGVSSEGELTRLIEERRNDGIFLSVIGVGTGNIKDNKMEALADKGNGNYFYLDNIQEAKKVLVGQLAGTLYTVATDVKLQVEFNPAKVKAYRLIGYENRTLNNRDFNDDKKDAGDMGAGHSVTALYEIIPAAALEATGGTDPLIYQRPEIIPSDELLQVKIRYKQPAEDTSILLTKRISGQEVAAVPTDNFRFAAAVAEYAMLLRNSEYKGQSSYRQVLDLAAGAKGTDAAGFRNEFIRMVAVSQLLDER
ncbi:MAG: von Willebrand factor type A domain-containing protein [Negativicutes bacterium]|nr:von Willebrand factor type A domain-containing protein [Negativicutes bacterium]